MFEHCFYCGRASEEVDRVALARAVYARTQFVLLDDPLSAVVSSNEIRQTILF